MGDHANEIKWPNGLSFYSALTRTDDSSKLLFNPEGVGNKPDQNHHPLILDGKDHPNVEANPNEFLSLDRHPESVRKMENKFKRGFTLPARMASSSSSTSVEQHPNRHPMEYQNSEAGMYSADVMETFLE